MGGWIGGQRSGTCVLASYNIVLKASDGYVNPTDATLGEGRGIWEGGGGGGGDPSRLQRRRGSKERRRGASAVAAGAHAAAFELFVSSAFVSLLTKQPSVATTPEKGPPKPTPLP
jgi:hypothetical protein